MKRQLADRRTVILLESFMNLKNVTISAVVLNL